MDDQPQNNSDERSALESLGLKVDTAQSNDEAADAIKRIKYDLIISDIGRGGREAADAGLALPGALARHTTALPPLIYYTGHVVSPETVSGYPVTDRPSELFRLVANSLGAATK